MSNRKHERIILRFEPLALRPHLHHYEGFPLKSIPQDHSVSQHLQRALSRFLDPQVPHLFPQEQYTRTRKLADAVISTTPQNYKVEHVVITYLDHKQNSLTTKDPYRMDLVIDSSNLCEKNKIDLKRKTQEILLIKSRKHS